MSLALFLFNPAAYTRCHACRPYNNKKHSPYQQTEKEPEGMRDSREWRTNEQRKVGKTAKSCQASHGLDPVDKNGTTDKANMSTWVERRAINEV